MQLEAVESSQSRKFWFIFYVILVPPFFHSHHITKPPLLSCTQSSSQNKRRQLSPSFYHYAFYIRRRNILCFIPRQYCTPCFSWPHGEFLIITSSLLVRALLFIPLSSHKITSITSQSHHSLRSRTHDTERSVVGNGGSRSLREIDNAFALRHDEDVSLQQRDHVVNRDDVDALSRESGNIFRRDSNGDSSRVQSDSVFRQDSDASSSQSDVTLARRVQTANATQYLNIEASIRACECDGTSCIAEPEAKHVGDFITICLWSNFLEIAAVSNMTLHVGNVSYQPVVNGIVNELTNVRHHGKLAVVTTMTISAFYQEANPPDLIVDATVSFVSDGGGSRRYLASDITDYLLGSQRSLLYTRMDKSVIVVASVCLFSTIVVLSIAVGALVAKRYCRHGSTRFQHEEEETVATCIYSK